jgi:hypothetical protein
MPIHATRGVFEFQVNGAGVLLASDDNIGALRRMWSDRTLVSGGDLGPGVRNGEAWHIACHLVAAGCVKRAANGRQLWLEISHDSQDDTYQATLTHAEQAATQTVRLDSAEATQLLQNSKLLGFIEGTSEGHISARGVQDSASRFGGWQRQNYDQAVGSTGQGGRVWEHWCTTRDLNPASQLSVSLLKAYLQLCNIAGDLFAATVARGRREYGHPKQLKAMISAGFTTQTSAAWQTMPKPIARNIELLLHEARAVDAFNAAQLLQWSDVGPTYYMYPRRINSWNP